MDEVTAEAFKGVTVEVANVKASVDGLRDEFREHVRDDRAAFGKIWKVLNTWDGQLKMLKWMAAATATAVIAHVFKHWN